MEIYLSNKIIEDLQYTDTEIATYMALKNLHASIRDTQVVTYNMLAYEIFGNKSYSRSAFENIKYAFNSLADRGMFTIVAELSKTEFVVDLSKLYFNFREDGTYYTVIRDDEIHKIMNLDNRMDKFKLLRYFVTCLRTICKTQGVYVEQDAKQNFVGFMAQEYLCKEIGVVYKSNFKLIEQYNEVLEQNELLYIYRHTEFKRDKITGQFKSFTNHYGRYEDKEDIIRFAINYEKSCGVNEEIVQSDKSNNKRRISAWYNNLCFDFKRYVKTYTEEELISIYKQVHHDNELLEKEIADTQEGTQRYENLVSKLRDEDIFDNIPCVVAYVNRKHKVISCPAPTGEVWGEPDSMDKDYSNEEVLEMPTADEASTNLEKPDDLIDIGAIFEEEHITKKAVGSSYIPDFEDDEIWDLY